MTEPPAAVLTPPACRPSFIDLRPEPTAVALGRRFTCDVISGHVADDDHSHTVVLLASELITNAFRACEQLVLDGLFRPWRRHQRPIRLALTATDRYVHLAVTDPDPRPLEFPTATAVADEPAETGRGLGIVDVLAAGLWVSYGRYDKTVHVVVGAPGVTLDAAELATLRGAS
jgi:hypothetical protein